MASNFRRLGSTGIAYGAGSVAGKLIAIGLLPLFTRYVSSAQYGAAEVLLQLVFALTMFLRLGIIEALFRFYHLDADPEYRQRILRTVISFLLVTTTIVSAALAIAAVPISHAIVAGQANLVRIAAFGLWTVSLYDALQAFFRVEGRWLAFLLATLANLLVTAGITVWLVVGRHDGASGLLLGNFLGNALVLCALLYVNRRLFSELPGARILRPMLLFGLPAMAADVTLYAVQVMDRVTLIRFRGLAEAGLYAVAIKLSQGVVLLNQAFYFAWAPLAYSIRDDEEARHFYARVFTYFLLVSATVVLATSLLAPWIVRLLAAPAFHRSAEAVPLVSLAVLLYSLYITMTVAVGRARRMGAAALAAAVATGTNIVMLLFLVPPLGIVGAGLALVGCCAVLIPVMYAFVRRHFPVPFEWRRILTIIVLGGGLYALGTLGISEHGVGNLALRAMLVPVFLAMLWPSGFFRRGELRQAWRSITRRPATEVSRLPTPESSAGSEPVVG